jgi:hypothetical protein
MPKLKYAGLKKGPLGETAFSHETGISWFPGTVKNVPHALAVRMLNHPDVFQVAADDEPEDDGDASTPVEAAAAPAPAVVVPKDPPEEDDPLTPAQQRMAQFAAGDTGNEDEFSLAADGGSDINPAAHGPFGDPVAGPDQVTETPTGAVDTSGMTLAPGRNVSAVTDPVVMRELAPSTPAPVPAPTPSPTPAPTAAPKAPKAPAKSAGKAKQRGGK